MGTTNSTRTMISALVGLALAATVYGQVTESQVATLTMTGNVEADFGTRPGVIVVADPGEIDVGMPPGFAALGLEISGWDIKDIRFSYNYRTDVLFIGVNCYGVCGDADGDGNPNSSAMALTALDLGAPGSAMPDGNMDFIIGYPSEVADDSDRFPCGDVVFDVTCFGLYLYSGTGLDRANTRFRWSTSSGVLPHATTDFNPATSPAKPDLEWAINDLNQLMTKAGFAQVDRTGATPWFFNALGFAGSFQDDGVGEDFYPAGNQFVRVPFPCFALDACDVCGGDGSSCADCLGTPFGTAVYDACDVCNGNGSSCADCRGTPNGTCQYDRCDVCCGDNTSCLDCAGTPNGPAVYDICDVCCGDNTSCLDCAGTPNGPAVSDICDVCNGNGESCRDCKGVILG